MPDANMIHVQQVLVSRRRIARRVGALGLRIAEMYQGRELTILAVLTGSLIFVADLIRALPLRMRLNLMSISSYPGQATTSRGPMFDSPLPADLSGSDVLIVDDICDSGQTLSALAKLVAAKHPASLRTCVLLKKAGQANSAVEPDFVGFEIADEFVVGYGLDWDNLYRNLPDICLLKEHAEGANESVGRP